MREILFRGKRVDNGEWVYWNQYGEYTEPYCTWHESRDHTHEQDTIKETTGEFTGLTDKNGVKIFEGDTIRWSEWQGTGLPNGEEELAIEDYLVEFINGMFVAKCLQSRFPTHCLLTEFDLKEGKLIDTEVVGNIHDKEF